MARPQTIHDFGGVDPAVYEIAYPVDGHPEMARRPLKLLVDRRLGRHSPTSAVAWTHEVGGCVHGPGQTAGGKHCLDVGPGAVEDVGQVRPQCGIEAVAAKD